MKRTKDDSHRLILFLSAFDELGNVLDHDEVTVGQLYEMERQCAGFVKGYVSALPKKGGDAICQ